MRIAFMGTPEFAVPSLEALVAAGHEVVAAYCQPPRPAGRGKGLMPSPVQRRAEALGIAVRHPVSLRDPQAQADFAALDLDVAVVAAYGLILPQPVLDAPRRGCLNVHGSLLPRWRGAAPIQRAILAGDTETGVDLMQMEAGLDTGPVLIERRTPIGDDDTGGSLHDRLATLGADALAEGLARVARGETLTSRAQAETGVVYAHKLEKSEARLDWNEPASVLARKVRAFDPWPATEAELWGERVRIWSAEAIDSRTHQPPGTIVATGRDAIDVATGRGLLRIVEVQREGGRRISVRDWQNARRERGANA